VRGRAWQIRKRPTPTTSRNARGRRFCHLLPLTATPCRDGKTPRAGIELLQGLSRLWINCRSAGCDERGPWKPSAFPPVDFVDCVPAREPWMAFSTDT